jgi:hypothetical protein
MDTSCVNRGRARIALLDDVLLRRRFSVLLRYRFAVFFLRYRVSLLDVPDVLIFGVALAGGFSPAGACLLPS